MLTAPACRAPAPASVFDDGTEHFLLKLGGTIPVVIKGNTYNIPVCIWMEENYPLKGPMPFVTPTRGEVGRARARRSRRRP